MDFMDINFTDLSEVPLPPKEVRIRKFDVELYPDGKRLRLNLELTPFLKPPSCEIFITDLLANRVATANIIEAIDPKMQLTLHMRKPDPQGTFTARALIFYSEDLEDVTENDQIITSPAREIVDETEVTFTIEG